MAIARKSAKTIAAKTIAAKTVVAKPVAVKAAATNTIAGKTVSAKVVSAKVVSAKSRPAAQPAPRQMVPVQTASEKVTVAPGKVRPDGHSLHAMPVQMLDAAVSQVEDYREITRDMALRSAESVRAVYDRNRIAAEESAGALENSFDEAVNGARKLQIKALENLQASAMSFFDLTKIMTGSANAPDAMTLTSEFYRKQMDASAERSREYAELVQTVTERAMSPLSNSISAVYGIKD